MTSEETVVCVVRCIQGTAVLNSRFQATSGAAEMLTLTRIEWYGREVEQLDTVHSGKVALTGTEARLLQPGMTLTSVE
jgi:hypothetical protein